MCTVYVHPRSAGKSATVARIEASTGRRAVAPGGSRNVRLEPHHQMMNRAERFRRMAPNPDNDGPSAA